nr:MAG TPA: Flagellar M-ring protein, Flagellar motor motor, switch complex, MOTOR [Caudoviricetes sp.]
MRVYLSRYTRYAQLSCSRRILWFFERGTNPSHLYVLELKKYPSK